MPDDKLALIAGSGMLPEIVAKRLSSLDILSLVIVLQGSIQRFEFLPGIVFESSPGKINKILNLLKKSKINKLLMIGKVDKKAFIERRGFDFKALKMLKTVKDGKDMSIFHAIIAELENIGIKILEQDMFLKDFLVKKGVITRRNPTKEEIEDAEYGIKYAKKLSSMDIGQSIVVKNKVITAIETVEGTDETIHRGAILSKFGAVVCKAGRMDQDNRFDIPAIGLDTLKVMVEQKCSLLALEADKIFIVEPDEVIKFADKNRVSIIGI